MRKFILTLLLGVLVAGPLSARTDAVSDHDRKMAWWREARFGMFVHWGPYCLYGGVYNGVRQQRFGAEWIMNICKIPVRGYRAMASTFDPQGFNADSLVLTAKRAGMKYVVLTAKHHDGFAMFQSDASRFNIKDYTRFGRDVVDEVAAACRRHDMRLGLYYSQNLDWNNPGGTCGGKPTGFGWPNPDSLEIDRYVAKHGGCWDPIQHSASHEAYFEQVSIPQVKELLDRYGDQLAVIFWDTPKGFSREAAARIDSMVRRYPQIVTNDRLYRPDFLGDYKTPEGIIPSLDETRGGDWETCMNIGSSWGYKSWDRGWKKPADLIRNLVTIVSRGGNYLLNVGPDAQGQIPPQALERLQKVADWMAVNAEAVYGGLRTEFSPAWGACIRKDDGRTTVYYLCVFGTPASTRIELPVTAAVSNVRRIDDGSVVPFTAGRKGLTVDVSGQRFDPAVTVLRVEMCSKQPAERQHVADGKFYKVADE